MVYLLHLAEPFGHAKHYLGTAKDLQVRLAQHEAGTGANMLRHVKAAGITWELARTWPGGRRSAIQAASIGSVPEPHIGSAKAQSPLQPVSCTIPAASASFSGARVRIGR